MNKRFSILFSALIILVGQAQFAVANNCQGVAGAVYALSETTDTTTSYPGDLSTENYAVLAVPATDVNITLTSAAGHCGADANFPTSGTYTLYSMAAASHADNYEPFMPNSYYMNTDTYSPGDTFGGSIGSGSNMYLVNGTTESQTNCTGSGCTNYICQDNDAAGVTHYFFKLCGSLQTL